MQDVPPSPNHLVDGGFDGGWVCCGIGWHSGPVASNTKSGWWPVWIIHISMVTAYWNFVLRPVADNSELISRTYGRKARLNHSPLVKWLQWMAEVARSRLLEANCPTAMRNVHYVWNCIILLRTSRLKCKHDWFCMHALPDCLSVTRPIDTHSVSTVSWTSFVI